MEHTSKNVTDIIFFGTQTFACQILQGLIDSPLFRVVLVITQPDKPVGRKKILSPTPVKILAESLSIPVQTPGTLKTFHLDKNTAPLAIVAQYGKIIPQSVLDSFVKGVINVHTSLLPKYRGASPIQSALMQGETETGVTIMKMDAGMDTGPLLSQKKLPINPTDTYTELDKELGKIATPLLLETLERFLDNTISSLPQDEDHATYCKILSRDDGKIDWESMDKNTIFNLYRGLTPWPGVWTLLDSNRLKLHKMIPSSKEFPLGKLHFENGIFIGCKNGSLEILEIQLEGKPIMDAQTFMNGYQKHNDTKLI